MNNIKKPSKEGFFMLFDLLDLSAASAEFIMAVDQNRSKTNCSFW